MKNTIHISRKRVLEHFIRIEDPIAYDEDGMIDFAAPCADAWSWIAGVFKDEKGFLAWFNRCDDNTFNMNVQFFPYKNSVYLYFSFQSDVPIDDVFVRVKGSGASVLKQMCEECMQKEEGKTCKKYLEEM